MISLSTFEKRRKTLMNRVGNNAAVIVGAAPEVVRTGDSHYSYRQNSQFYYLTGFPEPCALLVLLPGHAEGEFILFNRPRNPDKERWDGYIAGQRGACEEYGAQLSFPIEELSVRLPLLLENREKIYYPLGRDCALDEIIKQAVTQLRRGVRRGVKAPEEFHDVDSLLNEMRLIKDEEEKAIMRRVCENSAKAHLEAMKVCRPGMFEYDIEAELHYHFAKGGSRQTAYSSIVGGGDNACILHYVENNRQLKDGTLLLVDAGGELSNYASDITRTFPVNGKFSAPQKAIYELVLKSQLDAIERIKPGLPWNEIQQGIVKILTEGLVKLGILSCSVDALIQHKAYERFYMHNSGHWLGLDTHDVGHYKVNGEWRLLQEGMVLTVEPGLYIDANDETVPKEYRGIGVRIEDDVLVTKTGCEVLTKAVPKTVADIEAAMSHR